MLLARRVAGHGTTGGSFVWFGVHTDVAGHSDLAKALSLLQLVPRVHAQTHTRTHTARLAAGIKRNTLLYRSKQQK